MRRFLLLILPVALVLTIAACDLIEEPLAVDPTTIEEPFKVDEFDIEDIELIHRETFEEHTLTLNEDMLEGEVPDEPGTHTLTVEYAGERTTFEVELYDTHTVTFEDDDGTELGSETVKTGEDVSAPQEPERDGYEFIGWDGDLEDIEDDVVLTAEYEPLATHTVTFEDHDGTEITTETVETGEDVSAPEEPERDGYEFIGWDGELENIDDDVTFTAEYEPVEALETLTVHYIDVGQADATFIEGPDYNILVDAGAPIPGHPSGENRTVPYLESLDIERIDLLVSTHPHYDHHADLDWVLDTFEVGTVWKSGYEHTSNTYQTIRDAVDDALDAGEIDYHEPRFEDEKTLGEKHLQVLNPEGPVEDYTDMHDASISFILNYGDVDFLFTGDAEADPEEWMIDRTEDHDWSLDADVYQAGHHGSDTSSTLPFMEAVTPSTTIYSAGEGNDYGHPHEEFLSNVDAVDSTLYGTDENGTVIVESDGTDYTVEPERGGALASPSHREEQDLAAWKQRPW